MLLLITAMLWCSAFFILWDGIRSVSYHYLQNHNEASKHQDTLILDKEVLRDAVALQWVKKDEIRYQGRMFDIKQQLEKSPGEVMLVGDFDEWDDQLFRLLVRILENENEDSEEGANNIYWTFDGVLPAVLETNYYFGAQCERQYFLIPSFYSSHVGGVLSPPPDEMQYS